MLAIRDEFVTQGHKGLNNIDTWLCANKLSSNASKSSYSVFPNNDFTGHPSILIKISKLNLFNATKFIGITIDNR